MNRFSTRPEKHIAFFEPRCQGITHLPFTISTVDMIAKIFPEQKLVFYTERTHGDLTQQNISAQFEQINIDIPKSPKNRLDWLKEIFWDIRMMQRISRKKPEYLFCLGITWEIVLFAKLFLKKEKIIFFFHSMEQEIKMSPPPYKTDYWYWRSLEWKIDSHTQIVFGESIKNEIAKLKPKTRFESLDHPYLPRYDSAAPIIPRSTPLVKFAVLGGGQAKGKCEQLLFILEPKLRVLGSGIELSLKNIAKNGKIAGVWPLPSGSQLKLMNNTSILPPDELDDYINEKDFCLFLFPPDTYHFTASGSLLEAFAHLKPVVGFHNPYFDYVFNKMGDVGYLCNTLDEIAGVIKRICEEQDTAHYCRQQQNIKNGMKYFSPEYLANDMRKILDALGKKR